jgi:precorrin-6B C5,15-methyltransferase / cobalt-precorrin-6B C5,C15-methyltransferase
MSLPDPVSPHHAASRRWLSIVGIGADGVDGLSPAARGLISGAAVVFGGRRHLALAGSLIRGEARPWPSPFTGAADGVLVERGRQVCVLASGDPFLYGIGAVLAGRIDAAEILAVPAPSAFSLAAARLGWALQETAQVSLHGRSIDLLRPHLQPGMRVLALTSGSGGPAALAQVICEAGFGGSSVTVLEALGSEDERVRSTTAEAFDLPDVDDLNVVAVVVRAGPLARVITRAAGLADDLFEHDGQITKREIRAVTLSALAPRRGELLWDIGAGSGAVAIEWMLADPSLRAVAVERRSDRAARIRRNAAAFGVPGLEVIEGEAPAALQELSAPDAIFIGGGALATLDAALPRLRRNGRLVANAVTLHTEAMLLARHARLGGELTRIAITRADRIGATPEPSPSGSAQPRAAEASPPSGWRPALPVTQWTWIKP